MGQYEIPLLPLSFAAGEDLSNYRWYVGIQSGDTIVRSTTAGAGGVGIIQQGLALGENVPVETKGVSMAVYGGTIAASDLVTNDANGKLVKSTLATDVIVGRALVAGVSGDVGCILVGDQTNSANAAYQTISIPIKLAQITAAGTIATLTPGFAGKIVKAQFLATVPASTASKLATITPGVAGTAITGGAMALTTAGINTLGANVAGTSVTAGNSFTASQAINLIASSVTAFSEGEGVIYLTISR